MIYISKSITTGDGVVLQFHVVQNASIHPEGDSIVIIGGSWPSQTSFETGQDPTHRWSRRILFSELISHVSLLSDIGALLVASGDFLNGTVIPKNINDLNKAKLSKLAEMMVARDAATCQDLVTPQGTFLCDESSRNNYFRLMVASRTKNQLSLPSAVQVERKNESVVSATTAQITDLALAVHDQEQAALTRFREVRSLIAAASTIAEVEAITW